MILIDTSAWVDFLRGSQGGTCQRVEELVDHGAAIATTEVVVMEILAGSRDEVHQVRLRRLLRRAEMLPISGLDDYERAAELYRICRRGRSKREFRCQERPARLQNVPRDQRFGGRMAPTPSGNQPCNTDWSVMSGV